MPSSTISEETQLNVICVLIGTGEDVLPKTFIYVCIYIILNMPAYDRYLLMMSFYSKS